MPPLPLHLPDRLVAFFRRLRADRRGNVLLMTGAAIPLLMVAVGFGIDYARAQRLQTKLDAAADAAALATVDPTLLSITDDTQVEAAAETMFDEQIKGLSGLTVVSRHANVNDTAGGSLATLRKTTFTYTATSTNIFGAILKMANLTIGGTSVASASAPPSINFYIAMDTSPSMLLPTTSSGIANLTAAAWWSGEPSVLSRGSTRTDGCDFACHSNDMQAWNGGVYVIDAKKYAIYINNSPSTDNNNTPFFRVSCTDNSVYDSNGNPLGTNANVTATAVWSNYVKYSVSSTKVMTYCTGYNSSLYSAANPATLSYDVVTTTTTTTTNKKGQPVTSTSTSTKTYTPSVNFPDTFWLVKNYSTVYPGGGTISLRTDAEQSAAANLITYAYGVQQQYAKTSSPPTYQMQFFTFNLGSPVALGQTYAKIKADQQFGTMTSVSTLQNLTFPSLGDTNHVPLLPANIQWADSATGTVSTTNNKDTDFNTTLAALQSTILPQSKGLGTTASPQSVLIIITDGMSSNATDGVTQLTTSNINACTAIKKYSRIAILYTQYIPETINYTGNTSFNSIASTNVPQVQSMLQQCATQNTDGTYLMQTVSTDGDVSAALNTLFAMAVQSARLVQ
ncbi:TadE/TadG family type IV pilus assembly protein [Novosphingobium terrae]|uniref:TadE/TadG family type IV pilus assembly protein n=1 Tax=Novosphingobium terrae TaxID=2726189 RepID=UPI00197DF128|nr:pilus assembly protein TadG-related protein [Novosphingobium terrae]